MTFKQYGVLSLTAAVHVSLCFSSPLHRCPCGGRVEAGVAGEVSQPSAGTSVGGTGVVAPLGGPGAVGLPGAKPLKTPVVGGAGIPLASGGGLTYPSSVGLGGAGVGAGLGAKAPKPGYGNLGVGAYQQGVAPVAPYGGAYPQQYYPGGYVPAPLTPQQAKAAKYGPLQGFLGGTGGGLYRGGAAGCQGKYCGRRK
ncbi:elastin-like [Betta splendens]|uniref:Elastin-like n=1 Tax=Betta splendens TaxID=158456 RepID=A0A9W2Y7S7_BETSP|nr:elastin-like [Betta splendens]